MMTQAQIKNQKKGSTVFKEWAVEQLRDKAQTSILLENLFLVIVIIEFVTAKRHSIKEHLHLLVKC